MQIYCRNYRQSKDMADFRVLQGKLEPQPQLLSIDDYAKNGGPEVVWHLCSFYQDPLRS